MRLPLKKWYNLTNDEDCGLEIMRYFNLADFEDGVGDVCSLGHRLLGEYFHDSLEFADTLTAPQLRAICDFVYYTFST